MKAFIVSSAGIEDISILELGELCRVSNISQVGSVISFDCSSKDLISIAYRAQSVSRLCISLGSFVVSDLASVVDKVKGLMHDFKLGDWIEQGKFLVECQRSGTHDFTSLDMEKSVANIVINSNAGFELDYKRPDLLLYVYINDSHGFIGIDLAGIDLGTRDYRIFGHSSDLKAPFGYALAKRCMGDGVFLDPFSRSGAIAIEAALYYSGFPVNYYRRDVLLMSKFIPFKKDWNSFFSKSMEPSTDLQVYSFSSFLSHVRSSERNAKIAGVNKLIKFARIDLEYLDVKFEKHSVQSIASFPPQAKAENSKVISKLYDEFFYQAKYILSSKGSICLAVSSLDFFEDAAKKNGFGVVSNKPFSMGKMHLYCAEFKAQ